MRAFISLFQFYYTLRAWKLENFCSQEQQNFESVQGRASGKIKIPACPK